MPNPDMPIAPERDWVGQWYLVAAERGRHHFVDFGRVDTATGLHEWFDYSHSRGDGVDGMVHCARALGRRDPPIPRSRETTAPSGWRKIKILLAAARAPRAPVMKWRFANPATTVPPKDFEWKVFSPEETALIHGRAKAESVSVNAWMMARLNKVILPALLEGAAEGRWLFPVNMRGPVWLGAGSLEGLGNQSSGIPLKAAPDLSAAAIHEEIKRSLQNGVHWATWWMLHVGKIVGLPGMRHFSKSSEAKSFWLGSFTNVGIWDCPEAGADEAWLVAPPGSRNYPIGVGIVTWNGRMSVVLKIHASVCPDRSLPSRLFADFTARLLS